MDLPGFLCSSVLRITPEISWPFLVTCRLPLISMIFWGALKWNLGGTWETWGNRPKTLKGSKKRGKSSTERWKLEGFWNIRPEYVAKNMMNKKSYYELVRCKIIRSHTRPRKTVQLLLFLWECQDWLDSIQRELVSSDLQCDRNTTMPDRVF